MSEGLSILVHGFSKVGKSRFAATAPAPRLILDAEAGSRFVPGIKKSWDPQTQQPPVYDGTWDTCIVAVTEYNTITAALRWLQSGQHPFNSVVIDSISEVQQRGVDTIAGADLMKIQDWGTLLRMVSDTVRKFRDLVAHPTHPLWAVVYIAMTDKGKSDKWEPLVQGALRAFLPYYVDVCGYLFVNPPVDAEGTWPGNRLLVSPHPEYETGERVGGIFGQVIDNPNVHEMVMRVVAAQQAYQAPQPGGIQ